MTENKIPISGHQVTEGGGSAKVRGWDPAGSAGLRAGGAVSTEDPRGWTEGWPGYPEAQARSKPERPHKTTSARWRLFSLLSQPHLLTPPVSARDSGPVCVCSLLECHPSSSSCPWRQQEWASQTLWKLQLQTFVLIFSLKCNFQSGLRHKVKYLFQKSLVFLVMYLTTEMSPYVYMDPGLCGSISKSCHKFPSCWLHQELLVTVFF